MPRRLLFPGVGGGEIHTSIMRKCKDSPSRKGGLQGPAPTLANAERGMLWPGHSQWGEQ